MDIELREEPMAALAEHARVPIAFEVDRILVVSGEKSGPGRFVLTEQKLDCPYAKDYDEIDGNRVTQLPEHFDMSNWGLISAYSGGRRVGGTLIVFNTAGVKMLEGRGDLAVLWDLRVHPEFRGHGIGSTLLRFEEEETPVVLELGLHRDGAADD